MERLVDRRKSFKSPPIAIDGPRSSQEARRSHALEEQKRRRLQRVDSFRQLDQFADLNLGLSDEDEDDGDTEQQAISEGVAHFASLIPPPGTEPPPESRTPSPLSEQGKGRPNRKGKKKGKNKGKGKSRPSKWADKCMYAELLEMQDDPLWTTSWHTDAAEKYDGLPDDLESAWVALAPIPVGKRCLAVTMQSAGVSGVVPNTTLRSRLLGKVLLPPFPSPLPPNTILDCILDENWRKSGLLHVLDVVRWKGQDVGACEASFRFWWRDTRLLEMPVWPHPPPHKSSFLSSAPTEPSSPLPSYRFPYPITFSPVPYTSPTPLEQLLDDVIPRASGVRVAAVNIPLLSTVPGAGAAAGTSKINAADEEGGMQIDFTPGREADQESWTPDGVQEVEVTLASDGLILYVGEAAYESGESPLSAWVPRVPFEDPAHGETTAKGSVTSTDGERGAVESPLELFERLVRRRLAARQNGATRAPLASSGSSAPDTVEVEMI